MFPKVCILITNLGSLELVDIGNDEVEEVRIDPAQVKMFFPGQLLDPLLEHGLAVCSLAIVTE